MAGATGELQNRVVPATPHAMRRAPLLDSLCRDGRGGGIRSTSPSGLARLVLAPMGLVESAAVDARTRKAGATSWSLLAERSDRRGDCMRIIFVDQVRGARHTDVPRPGDQRGEALVDPALKVRRVCAADELRGNADRRRVRCGEDRKAGAEEGSTVRLDVVEHLLLSRRCDSRERGSAEHAAREQIERGTVVSFLECLGCRADRASAELEQGKQRAGDENKSLKSSRGFGGSSCRNMETTGGSSSVRLQQTLLPWPPALVIALAADYLRACRASRTRLTPWRCSCSRSSCWNAAIAAWRRAAKSSGSSSERVGNGRHMV